jgi:nucleoside 2-deoxyribosyltransferase
MGVLDKAVAYLSGPMEFVADHGIEWRRKFIRLVRETDLDIDFIDPTNKPGGEDMQIGENQDYQVMLQKKGKFKELKKYVHKYRHYDLRFVDVSDFLVALIDPSVPQWGTSNEVYVAEDQQKPIFLICDGGLHNLPRWLFDVIELHQVFQTVEEVVDQLVMLNNGELELDEGWVLVRKHIEETRNLRISTS